MWKVIILSALLSVVQGANIHDIYGNYTIVMIYNEVVSESKPEACLRFAVSEDRRNIRCSCSDGHNSTLVEYKILERVPFLTNDPSSVSTPTLAVDNVKDLMSVLNVATCKCGDDEFDVRSVVKYVNDNYMIVYERFPTNGRDLLLARTLPSNSELEKDIALIDELKNKNGFKMCSQEIYERLSLKN